MNLLRNLFMALMLLIITVQFTGCSHMAEWTKDTFEPKSNYEDVHLNHRALANQRLIPRPGFEGHLTNKVCLKFYGNKCEKTSIRKYSLQDVKVRTKLNEFKFACKVGGKRYRVCKDQPGLCRTEQHKVCKKWGRKSIFNSKKVCKKWGHEIKKKFLDSKTDYQFMLDGATVCKQGY